MTKKAKAKPAPQSRAVAVRVAPVAALVDPSMTDTQNALRMIGSVLQNPDVTADKIEVSWRVYQDMVADQRRIDFQAAFIKMRAELPTISKDGRIIVRHKDDKAKPLEQQRIIQDTKFATYENILEVVSPILDRHGFMMLDKSEAAAAPGRVRIVTVLARGGHEECSVYDLESDTTGSKNNNQGQGSSTTYAKRYNMMNLLKLLIKGTDTDGAKIEDATATPMIDAVITDDQAVIITDLLQSKRIQAKSFLENFVSKEAGRAIETVGSIPANLYDRAVSALQNHASAGHQKAAAV